MSKKRKTLDELLEEALVPEDEQPYEIPGNWVWTNLYNINEAINPNIEPSKFPTEKFILYSVPSFESGSPEIIYGSEIKSNKQIVEAGDVLISKINPRINRVWVVENHSNSRIIASTEWIIIKNNSINSEFLACYFKSPEFRNKLCSNVSGVGGSLTRARPKEVMQYGFPLAPRSEQKRLANKIGILFAKIDEAQQLIREAKDTFEYRLAAILSVLFQKNVESVKNKSENEPYKLPVGWKWLKLSEVGILKRGKSKHRPRNDEKLFGGPYPFIQTGDVARAEKYIETYSQTLSDFGLAQSALFEKGTLCITIAANIADTALLKFDSCFPDSVVGFSSNHEYISNEYIHYYISTIKQELEHYAPATAQKNINLKVLNEVLVPIPPQEEYLKIIGAIKYLELKERSVFNLINLEQQINQLKQSILSKAFKGELGTNDPTDEPAIELLKSILQEKL